MRRPSTALILAFALLAWMLTVDNARAQMEAGDRYIQAGLGLIPGIGAQGAFIQARALYTLEGALYADFTPRFAGGEGSLQLSGAVGGAIRAFGIVRALGSPAYSTSDLDIGFRLGPSLVFTLGESSRTENPFSLFLEPYGRFSTDITETQTVFAEIGLQRPILRAGLVLRL